MPLAPGTRIGVYEVTAQIGEGGMGQVFRARDTKLNRDVALKILPDAFASDPDRLARFTREAQTLAALNHPNIAHIHGLEESGGVRALVMELVEGEDLSQRITRGALPLDEALPIAKQIAEALEAAHEQGIIHRDLKPANIKVRADGTVKVLDFGLAKAMEPVGTGPNVSQSPTLTTPAMTQAGMILGTAAYMSPEQAKGRVADRRSDVWAFGVLVYEMLTGQRAFKGEDVSETLAFILTREPDWATLPADTPASIHRLLRRCLNKDRKRRLDSAAAARLEIDEALTAPSAADVAVAPPATVPRRGIATASVALVVGLVIAAIATWVVMRPLPRPAPQPVRFTVAPAGTLPLLTNSPSRDLALSPDGTHLVYVTGDNPPQSQLWVRAVDQLDPVRLRGVTGASSPFISPEGKWIGFYSVSLSANGNGGSPLSLMKVSMTGGPPIPICRLPAGLRGASWGPNDTIVFATVQRATGLFSVPAGGGEPQVLTTPDVQGGEVSHVLPSVLPGGQAVLFTIMGSGGLDTAQVAVLDLKSGQWKRLIPGGSAAEYFDPSTPSTSVGQAGSEQGGYLIYAAAGTLRAVRFDPVRIEVLSDPVPVVEQVLTKGTGAADFSVSRHGALVYVPGGVVESGGAQQSSLVWVDRQGHEDPLGVPPRGYTYPRLSPDNTKLALDIRDQGNNDIWVWDLTRHGSLTRLTTDPVRHTRGAIWSNDGHRIAFEATDRNGSQNIYWQAADGTGTPERLTDPPRPAFPTSFTPGGRLLFNDTRIGGVYQLGIVTLTGDRHTEFLLHGPEDERNGEVSPDGKWLAYESNESKQPAADIYVRPFPNVDSGRQPVSIGGGTRPVWAYSGRELFYAVGDERGSTAKIMAVSVQPGTTLTFGAPQPVVDGRYLTPNLGRTYDVSLDGKRFLLIKDATVASPSSSAPLPAQIVVVLNWNEELKRLVPTR